MTPVVAADLVRLLVVTDWDVGFPLTTRVRSLPDIAPGASYVTEVIPQYPVSLHEIMVESFALVKISIGERTITAAEDRSFMIGQALRRLYRLVEPADVDIETGVCLHLCNDSDVPRKPKDGLLIRQPVRALVTPTASTVHDEHVIEAENYCMFCGQTFQIAPDDPHWSTGRGPICPQRKA